MPFGKRKKEAVPDLIVTAESIDEKHEIAKLVESIRQQLEDALIRASDAEREVLGIAVVKRYDSSPGHDGALGIHLLSPVPWLAPENHINEPPRQVSAYPFIVYGAEDRQLEKALYEAMDDFPYFEVEVNDTLFNILHRGSVFPIEFDRITRRQRIRFFATESEIVK